MKAEQTPERIAILTPPGMTEADYSLFWVTPPCPGGEHVVKDTGHDYAEYVRADAVPFASWEDISRKLALLDSLAGSVAEAIRFADKGKGSAEANISAMDMVDIEACLDELTPGWRQRGAQHNG